MTTFISMEEETSRLVPWTICTGFLFKELMNLWRILKMEYVGRSYNKRELLLLILVTINPPYLDNTLLFSVESLIAIIILTLMSLIQLKVNGPLWSKLVISPSLETIIVWLRLMIPLSWSLVASLRAQEPTNALLERDLLVKLNGKESLKNPQNNLQ